MCLVKSVFRSTDGATGFARLVGGFCIPDWECSGVTVASVLLCFVRYLSLGLELGKSVY